MQVGIVLYSQTGNTLSVARRLQERLIGAGHSVTLEQLETVGGTSPRAQSVQLRSHPDVGRYEAIVLATPVQGFAPAPAMKSYLATIGDLREKKIAVLITQAFPFPVMGGNQTVAQMKASCEGKGGVVVGSAIVNWSNGRRTLQISEGVQRLSHLLTADKAQ